jgi:hypothetical protein
MGVWFVGVAYGILAIVGCLLGISIADHDLSWKAVIALHVIALGVLVSLPVLVKTAATADETEGMPGWVWVMFGVAAYTFGLLGGRFI